LLIFSNFSVKSQILILRVVKDKDLKVSQKYGDPWILSMFYM
jgi:hypothetical protein